MIIIEIKTFRKPSDEILLEILEVKSKEEEKGV